MSKKIVPVIQRTYDNDKYRDLLRQPFAHRGVHKVYPENSLPAFGSAIELGLAIELDIHLSQDGQIVVFHDDTLKRMTGEDKFVKYLNYDEIKSYRLNDTEYYIPLLSEVLSLVKGKVPILIEIKTNNNMKKLTPRLSQRVSRVY